MIYKIHHASSVCNKKTKKKLFLNCEHQVFEMVDK